MADFAKIKAEHSLESVAERLGLQLKKHGSSYRGPCPSGQGDERALIITPGKGWWSHAAKKGGSVIDLVAFVKDCTPRDAAIWIEGSQVSVPEKSTNGGANALKPVELVHDHPSVIVSGIEADDAKRFGIGYREPVEGKKRAGEGHILLPVYDNGRLCGYVGVSEITWLPERWR